MKIATVAPKKKSPAWRFKRWTRKEFYRLSEPGRLGRKPPFLLKGRIIIMPKPGPLHDFCLYTLIEMLAKLIPPQHFPRFQSGLGVGHRTDPGPDYAIVPGSFRDYAKDHPSRAIFVAEIAVNSRKVDLTIKPGVYAKAMVTEYWVVDVEKRCVVVHRDPIVDDAASFGGRYSSVVTYAEPDSVAPHFAKDSSIAIASLLPPVSA